MRSFPGSVNLEGEDITRLTLYRCVPAGELLSPGSLDAMDEVNSGEEAAASGVSSSGSGDLEDSLPPAAPLSLGEGMDDSLVPDIIAGTAGNSSSSSSLFQSALVGPAVHTHTHTHTHTSTRTRTQGYTWTHKYPQTHVMDTDSYTCMDRCRCTHTQHMHGYRHR